MAYSPYHRDIDITSGVGAVLGIFDDYQRQKRFEVNEAQQSRIRAQQMAEQAEQRRLLEQEREDVRNARRAQQAERDALSLSPEAAMGMPEYTEEYDAPLAGPPGIDPVTGKEVTAGTEKKRRLLKTKKFGDYTAVLDFGGEGARKRALEEKLETGQLFKTNHELLAELGKLSPAMAGLYRDAEYLPGSIAAQLVQAQKVEAKAPERQVIGEQIWERGPDGKWQVVATGQKTTSGTEGGTYKAVYDKTKKADVMANDAMIAKEPDRYGPPKKSGGEGKPLLSGEIGQIRDFVSGMNQLSSLLDEAQGTGTVAWAKSKTPGILSEWFGWGVDAKSRQASLDAAKQVIGKAMEGGVLRKEDEAKYMKILPIIKDPPDVARAKIRNLVTTMKRDAENYMAILEAGGRDIGEVEDIVRKTGEAAQAAVGGGQRTDPLGLGL